jgi:hypothetical protein
MGDYWMGEAFLDSLRNGIAFRPLHARDLQLKAGG